MKRIGVIGDVHGEDQTLLAALDFFARRGVDRVLCVGDVLDGPGDVERCITELRARDITTVRGNHERWFVEGRSLGLEDATTADQLSAASLAWVRSLPSTAVIETVAGAAMLCHSLGRNDFSRLLPGDPIDPRRASMAVQGLLDDAAGCRFVLNGHNHLPMLRVVGPLVVLNAGTLCRADEPCVMLVDFERASVAWHRCDGAVVAEVAARELPLPNEDAHRLPDTTD